MNLFIIKNNIDQEIFKSNKGNNFNENDIFLKYNSILKKLTGVYKLKKLNSKNKFYHYILYKIKDYRRSLDKNDLFYNKINIQFGKLPYKKLNKNKFNKIISLLEQKNFPQNSPDHMFITKKNNYIELIFLQTHPTLLNIKKIQKYNSYNLKTLNKFIDQLISKLINFFNINNEFKELEARIKKTFFHDFNYINKISNRYICINTDNKLSNIPFEIILNNKKNNLYASRLIETDEGNYTKKYNFSNSIKFLYPEYNKSTLNRDNEIKKIKKKLKTNNYEIYKKQFKITEFIKLIESSYIVHFSGHSRYCIKRKEYGLMINDNDIFYLSDFKQCLNVPDLISFHSCFEYKHIDQLHDNLKHIFQSGCKNIILPFTEIWEKYNFFIEFYLNIFNGMEIGKAYKFIVNSYDKKFKHFPLLFRLYGNPMEKYFKKNE